MQLCTYIECLAVQPWNVPWSCAIMEYLVDWLWNISFHMCWLHNLGIFRCAGMIWNIRCMSMEYFVAHPWSCAIVAWPWNISSRTWSHTIVEYLIEYFVARAWSGISVAWPWNISLHNRDHVQLWLRDLGIFRYVIVQPQNRWKPKPNP